MKTRKIQQIMIGLAMVSIVACSDPDNLVVAETLDTTLDNTSDLQDDSGELMPVDPAQADFTVTIENVVMPKPIFQSGVFNTPVGKTTPGPLFPGDAYEFYIDAGPSVLPNDGGTRLSFVTMFVQSNDLFFAPGEEGIALYNENGTAIGCNGTPVDVTDQIALWDAGTEVNEVTGGPNQKPQQDPMAEDQGVDENGVVTKITNNSCAFGNVLPENDEVIKVTIENIGPSKFKVRILNVSDGMTIATPGQGEGTRAPVPISPGVYAVHTMPAPFFEVGQVATGAGLVASAEGVEDIAEDGSTQALLMDTQAATGLTVPLSPGIWASHNSDVQPIYQLNSPDFGEGLEAIAEDGIPTMLAGSLAAKTGNTISGTFDTPLGATGPGAIGPGGSYQFSFSAADGDHLSLATMFVQSNDWFYAFPPEGIPLFENGIAISGDVSANIFLYDAGTEADEYPGAGLFQVIRQSSGDSGPGDPNTAVRLIEPNGNIPATSGVIRVTISTAPF